MNKNQSELKQLSGVYLWLSEEIEHDEKDTLTPI